MKRILLFLMILSVNVYAQTQEVQLKSNDWYVYKVVLNNQTYFPLNNVENQNIVNLNFTQGNNELNMNLLFCSEIGRTKDLMFIGPNEFTYDTMVYFGTGCSIPDNYEFNNYYWQYWIYDSVNHYQYEINDVDGTTKELIVTKISNGNKAYFYSTYLSSPSYVLEKVKIYPNPVKSILNIELPAADYQNVLIGIYDITGKKIKSFKENWQENISLNIENLPTGNYLLELKLPNEPGRGHFVKIIKE
ncbi:Por secretion system C-terminal sorting domain-containing protein [Paenimyroides aquimaris]|uniref:Por secretion system C-terminal sorting domain-containing protein n=1 Tax=Paenimyroides marinum TaxID=1159016 RepID=A0A1H6LLP3_9FLAO|nr:T9SS type A sorting domain-containing protein [Paenimyroides aquimaris]SEH89588.1 Por secretion system C-terminal sorting domain-containing protein [Paenimyroides aquimaris]